jgi:hypothetical protein
MLKMFTMLLLAYVLVACNDTHAQEYAGSCVFPATNPRTIVVYENPVAFKGAGRINALAFLPYRAEMRTGRLIAIWSVPETTSDSSKFIGWVDQSQFARQELRNCT